jgi:glutathione S-transferase
MKLYSGPLSLFTAKVRIALAEKGLPYQRIEVGWSPERRYQPHHPDVVALNPKRQVPVLVDGELVVYDSTLILEYLEDAYPETPLLPRDATGRARCRQLEAAADELLFPHVWDLIEEAFYPASAGGRDEARLARAREGVAAYCRDPEADLAAGPYLCGAYSIADIGNLVFLSAARSLGAPIPEDTPRVQAWLDCVTARPPVAKELAETQAYVASVFRR